MAHSNKQFIINLVIASLISLALVSFSMAPAYLFLIKNNWLRYVPRDFESNGLPDFNGRNIRRRNI